MNEATNDLRAVDRVEILTVIDNYVDVLLTSTDVVKRPPLAKGGDIPADTLLAEHGLSLLVTVFEGKESHTILFDTGYGQAGVPHNLKQLEVDLEEIETIVLSHGHMDHTGSLYEVVDSVKKPVPLVIHPDAFISPRYFILDDGRKLLFPQPLTRPKLRDRNVELMENRAPTLLADATIMVTGEVARVTTFEKGLPNAHVEKHGKLEKDPISDDQALVIHLKQKGLVIISGCSHAGIINTALYAREIAGTETIHAVLGGFHLSGPIFEQIIEDTIEELKKMKPEVLVPMHCTGWKAIQRFSEEFPDAFVLNSVGSKITLS
jgi:7,8-dihydropterin-6-yl-methyl-4-(beta-D-ribofuranosyl)aminobenzene 5'-phosphate synthase